MIYLYGAVDDAQSALDALRQPCGEGHKLPRGFDEIGALRAGGVAYLAELRPNDDLPARGPALVHHDLVLRQAMAVCTVIPFRFGTAVASENEFHRTLDANTDDFIRLFRRLRGRRELALRARPRTGDRPVQCLHSGRAYLRRLAGTPLAGEIGELHRILADTAVDSVAENDGEGRLKASYLVDSEQVGAFGELVATCQRRTGGIEVSLTGPWAPYSFVATIRPGSGRMDGAATATQGAADG